MTSYTGIVPNTQIRCRAVGCQHTVLVPMEPDLFRRAVAKAGWLVGPPQPPDWTRRHCYCPAHYALGIADCPARRDVATRVLES